MKISVYLSVAILLALAGCSGKNAVKPAAGSGNTPVSASSSGADDGSARGVGGGSSGSAGDAGATAPANRIIYFDFDSSEIRPEFTAVVTEHARQLSRNASVHVRLEGHTDERGSREYNIGLGERRAQAVRRALLLQGVAETQVATVSYGEERPAQAGSSEEVWAKNRRVELVYLN
jgi:peptidoglycan-associated lipoprotein